MSDEPKYTTAIIAAVPAADDPVHAHVIEDAHVTLQFLGEADTLTPEQIEDIKASLELMASNLYPFPADVSGTAELGPSKAKVLLVQSEPLTKIRDLLGTVPAVSTAVAASEQFPNWIPHLTLAYAEDGQVEAPELESVTIGSLELWMADEKVAVCELAKEAPGPVEEDTVAASVIAAGLKQFDEGLHPRDASGRFIEKFGIVKFLTGQGWGYGKVDGIYEENGQVKLTITPSDLSGKPSGAESKVMHPNQVYRAPKKVAHLEISSTTAKKIGGQGGSNPGGLYTIPTSGTATEPEKFYVKQPKTKSHGANEALANDLYAEAGVPVPQVDIGSDGKIYSKIVDGEQDMAAKLSANDAEWMDQVRRNFAVDAWLGNRDVFGMTYDNILTDENGTPWRIDNGGALLYRAMGEKKTDFGGQVTELDAFRQGKKAKIFGTGMTKAQELDGAERVVAILPNRIEEMVAEAGLPKSLADTLKARRLYIANYYGLTLPESLKAPEAQDGSSAPLVDPVDIAKGKGKARGWFPVQLHHASLLLQPGDKVEFPDGSMRVFGVDEQTEQPLSTFGLAQQQLSWTNLHGPDAAVFVRKTGADYGDNEARPSHGQKLTGNDLAAQRWQRGDEIITPDGEALKILGWNSNNGALLVQSGTSDPRLLDSFGADANTVFTVERWDPPAKETLEPVATQTPLAEFLAKPQEPQAIQTLTEPETPAAESQQDVAPQVVAPVAGKTGQAAEAEAKIKADLDQPLPVGNGQPAPPKTSAKSGSKEMLIGDGTTAQPGAEVVSKKDGKTYTFVKPKGQYAVVTDPNGEDPNKQLLKLASTMTQPGIEPSADTAELEKPKTATGEVPQLGMMAQAKDGWAGEITLISPDGKFVFITDATGKRKRKSTGTVSITSAPQTVPEAVDTAPATPLAGPIKPYGSKPTQLPYLPPATTGYKDTADITTNMLVHVGYADGTDALEPYNGQPLSSLAQNTQGKVATFGTVDSYQGPIAASHLISAAAADNLEHDYEVVWEGTIGRVDGSTGPNGGLWLWDYNDPAASKVELPPSGQILTIVGSVVKSESGYPLPQTPAHIDSIGEGDASQILYGDEAKTLKDWKGQLSAGSEISLDGKTWLEIKTAYPSGGVDAEDINGAQVYLTPWSPSTYVLKAPKLTDAAQGPKMTDAPPAPLVEAVEQAKASKPQVHPDDMVKGDVVLLPNGELEIIGSANKDYTSDTEVYVMPLGASEGEYVHENTLVTKLGNVYDGPVDMPVSKAIEHIYPGVKIQAGPESGLQVLTYPEQLDNGNWRFAVIVDGDLDNPYLLTVGEHGSADMGPAAQVGVHFALSQFPAEAGVDPDKVQALFVKANEVETTTPADHKWAMSEQGIEYGKAEYPIYTDGNDGYYRKTPTGPEVWDDDANVQAWVSTTNSLNGMEQAWEGKPSYNIADLLPEGSASLAASDLATYKAPPGAAVTSFQYLNSTYLVLHPDGNPDGPGHMILTGGTLGGLIGGDWKDSPGYSNIKVIQDPFGLANEPEPAPTSGIIHEQGPQPPEALANRLEVLGYTPSQGETILAVVRPTGGMALLSKQPDGTYKLITHGGQLKAKTWTLEEIKDPQASGGGATFYTWTHVPEGATGPTPVAGLPTGYAPFVPSEGQSVLKTTLASGIEKVYIQQQPGGGWYAMAPDGTVDESSDAIKSNHVVQQKLAGKGSQAVKYDLLHPKDEGTKSEPDAPPTFTNATGSFTPQPGQKVVSMKSSPNDNDPWYFVQSEPGGTWEPAEVNTMAGQLTDQSMQVALNKGEGSYGTLYSLVYGGQGGDLSAVDTAPDNGAGPATPSFKGYIPNPDEEVVSYTNPATGTAYYYVKKPGSNHWYGIDADGQVGSHIAVYANDMPENKGPEFGNDYKQEWPLPEAETPAAPGTPAFSGYTPKPGEVVWEETNGSHWVFTPGDQTYHMVNDDGTVDMDGGLGTAAWGDPAASGVAQQVWPAPGTEAAPAAEAAPITVEGYQTKPGESVIQLVGTSNTMTLVKLDDGQWHAIDNGLPNSTTKVYDQDTVEWLASEAPNNGTTMTVLQGSLKGEPVTKQGVMEMEGTSQYAGVKQTTPLWPVTFTVQGGYTPTAEQLDKLKGMPPLEPGQSLYLLDFADEAGSGGVLVRSSDGTWKSVWADGTAGFFAHSDAEVEQYISNTEYTIHKALWGAPTAAPAKPKGPAPTVPIAGWEGKIPDPASFGLVDAGPDTVGLKKGDWFFIPSTGGTGLFAQLAEDVTDPGSVTVGKVYAMNGGKLNDTPVFPEGSVTPGWTLNNASQLYVTGSPVGAPSVPSTPTANTPTPITPDVPLAPQYPGALAPSQEDINAWGGSLTKDGHIPTSGMFVTGKGPMSGKIISVSKDKTKAVVLTSDGKKTTRLIEALKTDKTANYQAYAAPVTAKDIPQGMPLAVDTVADTLAKTPKDGKFRAILTAHPGVSHGAITVTKATGPSGKVYNRVHLTLTPEQRAQLTTMLASGPAASIPKGDWVTSSKMSQNVAAGDLLPMRKSSQDNPDGTPRWKVDSSVTPPTHEVTGVTDDPSGSGVKIVTLKHRDTGEEITSRFHPNKSLTTYTWDPNKPKPIVTTGSAGGVVTLSEIAQAEGWTFVTDGGISAATGGAQNAQLKVEPGKPVPTGSSALGQLSSNWKTLRNVSADGVVIETVAPKGSSGESSTGTTVISVPEGVDETALGAAFAKLGIDYSPMTQDSAKTHVRGLLRNLLSLDTHDVDTPKHYSDQQLFAQAGQTMGISDLGWQDVLVGVDESTGKTSYFWSDRARNALAAKAKYNLVYRAASTGTAAQIVSTVKYGSASSMLKKTTGMLDGSSSVGNGASASSDNGNHAGHGSYASASTEGKLPSTNKQAGYKGSVGIMVYHRPEAVLGRIMDYRVANHDAFGMGKGQGADHLKEATSMSSVKDYFLGGGLPTEAVGFVAVQDAGERAKAIEQLKKDGFTHINGRAVEEIVITKQQAAKLTPNDLPPVTLPSNARPILDLPTSYDAPAAEGGEAPAVTASAEDAPVDTPETEQLEVEVA